MKLFCFSKRFIFLLVCLLLISVLGLGFYTLDSIHRGLANFSNDEIEYAEDFLLREKTPDYSELSVHSSWTDDLGRQKKKSTAVEQILEAELQAEYDQKLLKALKKRTGKEPIKTNLENYLEAQGNQFLNSSNEEIKKEMARSLVINARKDGYEIVLDENYEVRSVRKVPQGQ